MEASFLRFASLFFCFPRAPKSQMLQKIAQHSHEWEEAAEKHIFLHALFRTFAPKISPIRIYMISWNKGWNVDLCVLLHLRDAGRERGAHTLWDCSWQTNEERKANNLSYSGGENIRFVTSLATCPFPAPSHSPVHHASHDYTWSWDRNENDFLRALRLLIRPSFRCTSLTTGIWLLLVSLSGYRLWRQAKKGSWHVKELTCKSCPPHSHPSYTLFVSLSDAIQMTTMYWQEEGSPSLSVCCHVTAHTIILPYVACKLKDYRLRHPTPLFFPLPPAVLFNYSLAH